MRGGLHNPPKELPFGLPIGAGSYLPPPFGTPNSAALSNIADQTLLAIPIYVPAQQAVDRISCYLATAVAGGASGAGRFALYGDRSPNGGYPGAGIALPAAEFDLTTTGAKEVTVSQTLPPGVYWLASIATWTGATTPQWRGFYPDNAYHWLGLNTLNAIAFTSRNSGVAGALAWASGQPMPDPYTASQLYTNPAYPPLFCLRCA